MDKTPHGWNVFDAQIPILTYAYSFGPGVANALAVGCEDGLMVLSPPREAEDALADLERFGTIRALVATNAFHHMGLAQWKTLCPTAELFAPTQSIARVERQTGLRGIQPIDNARAIAGPRLELVDMPFYKTGELLLRIDSKHGLVWYVTDVIMNMRELPRHPLARLAFRLSGSAPGLRYNNIAPLFMVRDKAALRRWLADAAKNKPPRWLIPAHGDIVDLAADPEAARRLFATT